MQKFIFILITLFVISCSQTKNVSLMSKKYCKLERLEFQEISDTVSVKRNGEFKSGIIANGKVILTDKISIDSVGAQIGGGNKVFFDQKTFRTVKVSQEFYEKYTQKRTALCQIIEGIKDKIISSKEGRKRAEELYLDIVQDFSGIKSDEAQKKN